MVITGGNEIQGIIYYHPFKHKKLKGKESKIRPGYDRCGKIKLFFCQRLGN